jgi:hypothetical protein
VPDREVPLAEAPSPPTGPVDNYLKEASS